MHDLVDGLTAHPFGAVIPVVAGGLLGLVFYGGLWWTVRRAATFRRPGPSVLASLLLRMGVTLGGFHLIAGDDWARLLLCLTGFLLSRAVVTWRTRPPSSDDGGLRAAIGRHAP